MTGARKQVGSDPATRWIGALALLFSCCPWCSADSGVDIVVIVGAAGADEYGEAFSRWTDHWHDVAEDSGKSIRVIGDTEPGDIDDRESLRQLLTDTAASSDSPLWLVLIGHGTYGRDVAKFNLRGPDVSAKELSEWLEPIRRPLVMVNCSSASGPFINRLSRAGRVIVTATKSGTEQNYARFGKYFARAILSADSDLDHDDAVSVQEAFLRASAEVQEFYDNESRISTEHALIDDNGDQRGTPAKMFRGVRAIATAKDGGQLDGKLAMKITLAPVGNVLTLSAEESTRRDQLEERLEALRQGKASQEEEEYLAEIEPIMIELAKIYRAAERRKQD